MRYSKNKNMLTDADMDQLKKSSVLIAGCGGLGGYVIEMLSRLGVGHIICVDGDVFDQSNWNRQLYATEHNLNVYKSTAAQKRVQEINSEIRVSDYAAFLDTDNIHEIAKDCDVVVDALDNVVGKLMLEVYCKNHLKPLVHGAIGGWYGQVTTVLPGDDTLSYLYKNNHEGIEKTLGNPSFTPATIASIQVAEVLKLLLNKGGLLQQKILMVDLLNHDYDVILIQK